MDILMTQGKDGMRLPASHIYLPLEKKTVDKKFQELDYQIYQSTAEVQKTSELAKNNDRQIQLILEYLKDPTIPISLISKTSWTEFTIAELQYFIDGYYNDTINPNLFNIFFNSDTYGKEAKVFYLTGGNTSYYSGSVRLALNFYIFDSENHNLTTEVSGKTKNCFTFGIDFRSYDWRGYPSMAWITNSYTIDYSSDSPWSSTFSTRLKNKIFGIITDNASKFDDPQGITDFITFLQTNMKTVTLQRYSPDYYQTYYGTEYRKKGSTGGDVQSTLYLPTLKEIYGLDTLFGVEAEFKGTQNFIKDSLAHIQNVGSNYDAGVTLRDGAINGYYTGNRPRQAMISLPFGPRNYPPTDDTGFGSLYVNRDYYLSQPGGYEIPMHFFMLDV